MVLSGFFVYLQHLTNKAMKKVFNWSFIILSVLIISFITSCGGDDEGDNDGKRPSTDKRICKIVEESSGTIRERVFTYDTEGRIIEIETAVNSATNSNTYKTTYQYGETMIIRKSFINGKVINDNRTNLPHTYSLKNGRIILDEAVRDDASIKMAFSYDNNGYMQSYSGPYMYNDDNYNTYNLIWEDGNLSKMDLIPLSLSIEVAKYSNLPWNMGEVIDINTTWIPYTDPVLLAAGYYGKLSKNLPSEYENNSYQYSYSNGLLTKVIKNTKDSNNEGASTTTFITLSWE